MYTLEIMDTAGTEQFKAMKDLYMKFGNCGFMETSAKNRISVQDVFFNLVRQINSHGIDVKKKSEKKSTCCTLL